MSLYVEDIQSNSDFKTKLAMEILTNIVPRLLNDGVYIGTRVSLAYTWSRFLCKADKCPDTPSNIRDWDLSHIKIVADSLVDYAMSIIEDYVKTRKH